MDNKIQELNFNPNSINRCIWVYVGGAVMLCYYFNTDVEKRRVKTFLEKTKSREYISFKELSKQIHDSKPVSYTHLYFTQRENQHRTGVFSIRSSGGSFAVLKTIRCGYYGNPIEQILF